YGDLVVLPCANGVAVRQRGVVRYLKRPRSRDAATDFNRQVMGGLSCDRSVVRKGICYDCTKTYHSAFNVNNAGLQSSTIEGGRAAGWDRQSRGFDVERG